jgi:hypothetical protein
MCKVAESPVVPENGFPFRETSSFTGISSLTGFSMWKHAGKRRWPAKTGHYGLFLEITNFLAMGGTGRPG